MVMSNHENDDPIREDFIARRLNDKGRYSLYYPETQHLADSVKRKRYPKEWLNNPLKRSGQYLLDALFSAGGDEASISYRIRLLEYIMRERSNTTLFIPSKQFPQTLCDSTFDIDSKSFRIPFGGYMYLAFRKGTIVDGVPLRGCCFSSMSGEDFKKYNTGFLSEYAPDGVRELGDKMTKECPEMAKKIADKRDDYYEKRRIEMGITDERADFTKDSDIMALMEMADDGNTLFLHFSTVDIQNVLSEGIEGFSNGFDKYNPHTMAATTCDRKKQAIHLRVCATICCYIAAFPGAVIQGAPFDYKNDLRIMEPGQYTRSLSCGEHRDGVKVSVHFRRGHFASLRHERFRRDKYGNTRIIFKRSCVVGADIDAHTLEGKRHHE